MSIETLISRIDRKDFQPAPRSGVRVAIGCDAWGFAERHHHPIMVLPDDKQPNEYRWPSDGGPALVYERGEANNATLKELATELLLAGASSVVALRESLLDHDPRVFFDLEVLDVAA